LPTWYAVFAQHQHTKCGHALKVAQLLQEPPGKSDTERERSIDRDVEKEREIA
jgi:hypothetical protein